MSNKNRYWLDVRVACIAVRDGEVNEILDCLDEDAESVVAFWGTSDIATEQLAQRVCDKLNEKNGEQ